VLTFWALYAILGAIVTETLIQYGGDRPETLVYLFVILLWPLVPIILEEDDL
jgi:hypothetical protein